MGVPACALVHGLLCKECRMQSSSASTRCYIVNAFEKPICCARSLKVLKLYGKKYAIEWHLLTRLASVPHPLAKEQMLTSSGTSSKGLVVHC